MKLDPVFVLPPEPARPPGNMSTRRAFVCAGIAGLAGWASGYGVGTGSRHVAPSAPIDRRLERGLELARPSTPFRELLDNQYLIISLIHETEALGNRQATLWQALSRIAREVADNPDIDDRRLRARTLLDVLRREYPADLDFDLFIPDLRRASIR